MAPSQDQRLLVLSFIAYAGSLTSDPEEVGEQVRLALDLLASLTGDQELVWGPASVKPTFALFDSAMVYAVRSKAAPDELTMVLRGTNPVSLWSWLFEDLWVRQQVPWGGDAPAGAFISRAAELGLQLILDLVPAPGLPGAGHRLVPFLETLVANLPEDAEALPFTIQVTGHSLGGTLAPCLALRLHEIRESSWPKLRTAVRCHAFAGPTAGNAAFAGYLEAAMGDACLRIPNPLDVVPHAWNEQDLRKLYTLFEPEIPAPWLVRRLIAWALREAEDGGYTHPPRAEPLPARLEPLLPSYTAQTVYQHSLAYLKLLKLDPREIGRIVGLDTLLRRELQNVETRGPLRGAQDPASADDLGQVLAWFEAGEE